MALASRCGLQPVTVERIRRTPDRSKLPCRAARPRPAWRRHPWCWLLPLAWAGVAQEIRGTEEESGQAGQAAWGTRVDPNFPRCDDAVRPARADLAGEWRSSSKYSSKKPPAHQLGYITDCRHRQTHRVNEDGLVPSCRDNEDAPRPTTRTHKHMYRLIPSHVQTKSDESSVLSSAEPRIL